MIDLFDPVALDGEHVVQEESRERLQPAGIDSDADATGGRRVVSRLVVSEEMPWFESRPPGHSR